MTKGGLIKKIFLLWIFFFIYFSPNTRFIEITHSCTDKINISGALDGLSLPYANLGCEAPNISTSNGQVSITGYNYSEAIIAGIKDTYTEAKWTLYDTYVVQNGIAYKTIGGTLVENGHTYILTVTPTISDAVNGAGSFSSTSVTTKLVIQMA